MVSLHVTLDHLKELAGLKMSKELPRLTCQIHAHSHPSKVSMAHGHSSGSTLSSSDLPIERRVITSSSDTASTQWKGSHKDSAVTASRDSARESTTSNKRQPQIVSRLTSSTPATPFDSAARRGPAAQHARARPVLSRTSGSVESLTAAQQKRRMRRAISDPNQLQSRAPVKSRNLASSDTVCRSSSAQSAYPDLHRLKRPTVGYDAVSGGLAFDTEAAARNKSQRAAENATWGRRQYTTLSVGRNRSAYPAWARVDTGQTLKQSIASAFLTLVANVLCGLLIVLQMCMRVVMAPAELIFAACISSQPPWAVSSPVESSVRPQRPFDKDYTQLEDTRRPPSTEDEWIAEALLSDYGFSI